MSLLSRHENQNYDSEDKFSPAVYVQRAYPKVSDDGTPFVSENKVQRRFLLKCLADFFVTKAADNLKVLDYGCGPIVLHSASAAPKASEVVFAEYASQNRTFIQNWVQCENKEIDLSPYFKYIVQTLEGGSEEEAMKREKELRSKVKAVVECDLTKDQFIAEGYEGPYDVVICSLVIGVVCRDPESYAVGIKRLASLIKGGGHLLLYTTAQEDSSCGFYTINGTEFHFLSLQKELIFQIMEQSGFSDIYYELTPYNLDLTAGREYIFISARKKW